jgi:hypothetical protein
MLSIVPFWRRRIRILVYIPHLLHFFDANPPVSILRLKPSKVVSSRETPDMVLEPFLTHPQRTFHTLQQLATSTEIEHLAGQCPARLGMIGFLPRSSLAIPEISLDKKMTMEALSIVYVGTTKTGARRQTPRRRFSYIVIQTGGKKIIEICWNRTMMLGHASTLADGKRAITAIHGRLRGV